MRPPPLIADEVNRIAASLADPRSTETAALDDAAMRLFRENFDADTVLVPNAPVSAIDARS